MSAMVSAVRATHLFFRIFFLRSIIFITASRRIAAKVAKRFAFVTLALGASCAFRQVMRAFAPHANSAKTGFGPPFRADISSGKGGSVGIRLAGAGRERTGIDLRGYITTERMTHLGGFGREFVLRGAVQERTLAYHYGMDSLSGEATGYAIGYAPGKERGESERY